MEWKKFFLLFIWPARFWGEVKDEEVNDINRLIYTAFGAYLTTALAITVLTIQYSKVPEISGDIATLISLVSASALAIIPIERFTTRLVKRLDTANIGKSEDVWVLTSPVLVVLFPLTFVVAAVATVIGSGISNLTTWPGSLITISAIFWLYLGRLRARGLEILNEVNYREAVKIVVLSQGTSIVLYLIFSLVTVYSSILMLTIIGLSSS